MEIAVNVGVRSFIVKLEDDGAHILHSKVVTGPTTHNPSQNPPDPASRNMVYVPKQSKGKEPINSTFVDSLIGKTVEHSSGLGQQMRSVAYGSQGDAFLLLLTGRLPESLGFR